jgi:hypothetical protein
VPLALPIWTLLIWTTRIRNIVTGDWSAIDLLVPIGLTVLAVVALVDRRRGVSALAAATVAVWAVRLPLVLVHHHGVAFKLVHTVLALVSFGLAYGSWRAVSRRPQVATRG